MYVFNWYTVYVVYVFDIIILSRCRLIVHIKSMRSTLKYMHIWIWYYRKTFLTFVHFRGMFEKKFISNTVIKLYHISSVLYRELLLLYSEHPMERVQLLMLCWETRSYPVVLDILPAVLYKSKAVTATRDVCIQKIQMNRKI